MRKTTRRGILLALTWLLGTLLPAGAVADEEVFRNFRFNFVNPGGRALAMGGAFIGIADDATAAAANPAGLTNLLSPELFMEWRLADGGTSRLDASVADPRGGPGSDAVLTESTADPDNILHPSFISYVHPFDHWVFGLSRQEVLNTDVKASNLFSDKPTFPPTDIVLARGRLQTLLEYYNLSFGFRGGEKFAAGINFTYARLDVESRTDNLFNFGSGLENDYATAVDDAGEDFTYSVGLLFKPIEKLRIGLVYRQGPVFDLEERIEDTRPDGNYPSALVLADFLGNRNLAFDPGAPFGLDPSAFDDALAFNNRFHIPDQYGIGIGIQPTDALTIAIDVVHVEYSDLEDGLVGNVNALTFPGDAATCAATPDGGFPWPCEHATPTATYRFDDATFWRLGVEYLWTLKEKVPFAVRAGIYSDPSVRLEADFGASDVFIATEDTFPAGGDHLHYTLGFGLVLQEKFQADFAADFSNSDATYIASFIFHF